MITWLPKHKQGVVYAISSGLCYGLIGYFGVTLMNLGLSVFNMLFWRFAIATVCVLMVLLSTYKNGSRVSIASLKVLVYGIVFYGTGTIAYFIASQHIGTGLSMVIFFSFPAMVVLLNIIFYKTKISMLYCAAFSTIIAGMICLADKQAVSFNVLGIALGLLSAFCYACYIFSSKRIMLSPLVATLMVCAGCMTTCLVAAMMDSSLHIPTGAYTWLCIISMGLVCTALPILLLLKALQYISSEKASMLSVLEPVFVVIFGIVLLDEQVTNLQMLGIVVLLSGALMTLFPDKAKIAKLEDYIN